jgi:protein arginine N-methyltransferase 7
MRCSCCQLQCHIAAPKQYLHRQLPDTPRLATWCAATAAAVAAVAGSARQPRVLLLGAKAGLLALAAARAGAVHVTCVEQ